MQNYSAFTLSDKHPLNRLSTPVTVNSNYRDKTIMYSESTKWPAVWDTGATNSCISQQLVEKLGLIPISVTNIATANGTREANMYLVNITLPNGLTVSEMQVSGVDLKQSHCDLLIGMDIICLGDFTISNVKEKTVFSFRTPSIEITDYVKMKKK